MERSNLQLVCGDLSVKLLPEFGGRISSISVKGRREWIAQPKGPLVTRAVGDKFIRPEVAGWDEMVPTTDACISLLDEKELPDHGEVWARSWDVIASKASSATLQVQLISRTLEFTRGISLEQTLPGQWKIQLSYRMKNTGSLPVPAFWSCHPLIDAEGVEKVTVFGSTPMIQTAPEETEVSQTYLPQDLAPNTSAEFWCDPDSEIDGAEILRSNGERMTLGWKLSEIPYFGIFIDNQEFRPDPVISPQPAIAHKVSERSAQIAERITILDPGQEKSWTLNIALAN